MLQLLHAGGAGHSRRTRTDLRTRGRRPLRGAARNLRLRTRDGLVSGATARVSERSPTQMPRPAVAALWTERGSRTPPANLFFLAFLFTRFEDG